MSAINPDEIISILKEEIENYDEISQNQEVGTVISVGDGIATVYGIDHAMYGEVVVFENGLKGMVQDIRTNSMGCILFGKDTGIKEGTKVTRTGKEGAESLKDPLESSTVNPSTYHWKQESFHLIPCSRSDVGSENLSSVTDRLVRLPSRSIRS